MVVDKTPFQLSLQAQSILPRDVGTLIREETRGKI